MVGCHRTQLHSILSIVGRCCSLKYQENALPTEFTPLDAVEESQDSDSDKESDSDGDFEIDSEAEYSTT